MACWTDASLNRLFLVELFPQLPYAAGGKGRPHLPYDMWLPYAGGGKGPPGPLHPRPRAAPLGTPI